MYLYEVCIENAYILMRESPKYCQRTKTISVRTRAQLEFRMKLAHFLAPLTKYHAEEDLEEV